MFVLHDVTYGVRGWEGRLRPIKQICSVTVQTSAPWCHVLEAVSPYLAGLVSIVYDLSLIHI